MRILEYMSFRHIVETAIRKEKYEISIINELYNVIDTFPRCLPSANDNLVLYHSSTIEDQLNSIAIEISDKNPKITSFICRVIKEIKDIREQNNLDFYINND